MLKHVREFSDNAWEELEDADKYVNKSIEWKTADQSISDTYLDLAKQEIAHYHIICNMANRMIHGCEDEKVKYVWDWMCEKLVEKFSEVNAKINMSR